MKEELKGMPACAKQCCLQVSSESLGIIKTLIIKKKKVREHVLLKRGKVQELLTVCGIDELIPKGTKGEWYDQLVLLCVEMNKVYSIAEPSVWKHHEALGLDDLREVVLLRRKMKDVLKHWKKRPFKDEN